MCLHNDSNEVYYSARNAQRESVNYNFRTGGVYSVSGDYQNA